MAAMTVTTTILKSWRSKDKRYRVVDLAFDAGAYATGGIALDLDDLDLTTRIDALCLIGHEGYIPHWDYATDMLEIWYADYSNAGDGPLVEYPVAAMVHNHMQVLVIGW